MLVGSRNLRFCQSIGLAACMQWQSLPRALPEVVLQVAASLDTLLLTLSCLLVQELKPKTKIGISGQFDATNPNTKPKVGFAFDLKN